jgi:AraC-like DNA-binding protein
MFHTDPLPVGARASAWRATIQQAFPGMRVLDLPSSVRASLHGAPLTTGAIFKIETTRKHVSWSPPAGIHRALYLLLATNGGSCVAQAGRQVFLAPETFVFIDGAHPFELSVADCSTHVLVKLPRDRLSARLQVSEGALARASSPARAGDRYLAHTLESLANTAPSMSVEERSVAERSLLHLLALASVLRLEAPALERRLERALNLIETHAHEPSFDASVLADMLGVSRRYLDRLLANANTTASCEIWERRLRWAAEDLGSAADERRTVLDIALGAGFSGAAHFSRAFRRRFGCTPSHWRRARKP